MPEANKWIADFLKNQTKQGLLRSLHPATQRPPGKIIIDGKTYIDFSSNDYLGLSNHPTLKATAIQAIKKYGCGAGASRLLSGDLEIYHVLEEKIARLKGKEAALWFNSGYQANVGLFKALLKAGDAIFADKLSHASLIDGAQLSEAVLFRFHHNNLNHLEMLLKKYRAKYRQAIIVTESIFSMDGDRAPLKELTALKEKHHCLLMVDEAHATGIFGKNGAGVVEEENLSGEVDLIMGTFSKALGSFGAYVAADKTMIQYLVNTCRSFIYSTALPPAVAAANLAALKLLKTEPARRHILLKNAKFFRAQLIKAGFKTKGDSQIIPLIIGDNQKTMALSHKLKKAGYWVLPIRPPSVPPGEARLRFSLSYCHAQNSLEKLIKTLTT